MFKINKNTDGIDFTWEMLGNIEEGRPNLGTSVDVAVYRLMQLTLRKELNDRFGSSITDDIFYNAGFLAGSEIYKNLITEKDDFDDFLNNLQQLLKDMGVGILRIEKSDLVVGEFTIVVYEDLDCSGLPVTDEEICVYDEGLIAGLLESHTGKKFSVKEVDCWCSGDRACRFDAKIVD